MTAGKRYITQLTANDFDEIVLLTNLNVQLPLRLEKDGDSMKLYIEENKLKDMLWSFVSQIVPLVTVDRADAGTVTFDRR